jgi:hypothetical protein
MPEGKVIRRESSNIGGDADDVTVAVTIEHADRTVKTIIGRPWLYPELAVVRKGDQVAYKYGDTMGVSQFDINWDKSPRD